jgi:hypothetical protein
MSELMWMSLYPILSYTLSRLPCRGSWENQYSNLLVETSKLLVLSIYNFYFS